MTSINDPGRARITYNSAWRLYGLCWSSKRGEFRLAASSFIQGDYKNKLQIIHASAEGTSLVSAAEIDHPYPPTKVMWSPENFGVSVEHIATTADYLRIWDLSETGLSLNAVLSNKRNCDTCAPLTSFDWNDTDPTIIGTSSIDTTCTIWDLNNAATPKQQIIAHDAEVYDMAFSDGTNVFGSVGADGSLRIFDLRSLESSTIVYETQDLKPLLRIAWNKQDPRYIATIVSSSDRVVILDLRNAARPVFELSSHTGNINSISWSQQSRHHICSAAEDGKAIMWDLGHTPDGGSMEIPTLLYHSLTPINQIRWSPTEPSWLALCEEESLHVLQV